MSHAIVIGRGSIGERHTRALRWLGNDVSFVSRRSLEGSHGTFREARDDAPDANLVIIATEASQDIEDLIGVREAGYRGLILVEKPLAASLEHHEVQDDDRQLTFVAYNLRFHPVVAALREELAGAEVLRADFIVDQHLHQWRPDRDLRASYSAHKAKVGGVLRDLSHELDLATWLLGPWRSVTARGGRLGEVSFYSDDTFVLVGETDRCGLVTIQLGALGHRPKRTARLVALSRRWTPISSPVASPSRRWTRRIRGSKWWSEMPCSSRKLETLWAMVARSPRVRRACW